MLRKLIMAFASKQTAAAMEAESRDWMMRCPCGHETSVWEAGGIRYKASGSPKRRARCPKCGVTWHSLYRKSTGERSQGAAP